jgi:hypothetical protein
MARRGKAASRQARQRRRSNQRAATQRQPAPPSATQGASAPAATSTSAAGAPSPSAPAAPSRASVPASQRGSRVNPRVIVAGSSRLSERAIEEYHYVRRDLRNIAILMAVMAVILVAAVLIFSALGIGKTA